LYITTAYHLPVQNFLAWKGGGRAGFTTQNSFSFETRTETEIIARLVMYQKESMY